MRSRRRPRVVAPVETVEETETVERGDLVVRLPQRLDIIEAGQADIRREITRVKLGLIGIAALIAATGGPQAVAALKALGIFG